MDRKRSAKGPSLEDVLHARVKAEIDGGTKVFDWNVIVKLAMEAVEFLITAIKSDASGEEKLKQATDLIPAVIDTIVEAGKLPRNAVRSSRPKLETRPIRSWALYPLWST